MVEYVFGVYSWSIVCFVFVVDVELQVVLLELAICFRDFYCFKICQKRVMVGAKDLVLQTFGVVRAVIFV